LVEKRYYDRDGHDYLSGTIMKIARTAFISGSSIASSAE
jgi:hypothetical protein